MPPPCHPRDYALGSKIIIRAAPLIIKRVSKLFYKIDSALAFSFRHAICDARKLLNHSHPGRGDAQAYAYMRVF